MEVIKKNLVAGDGNLDRIYHDIRSRPVRSNRRAQEKLGLRLATPKGAGDIVVIDHADARELLMNL